jgi:hypothetical protein
MKKFILIRYESQLSEMQLSEGKCPGKAGMIPTLCGLTFVSLSNASPLSIS